MTINRINMIPKIIHYCWFGRNPLPPLAVKCIDSWKKYFPDYEIKEWNEDNFDVNIIPYTEEAYRLKKYAFVSDYARFWILYHYGGLYFDTDVEVIKSMDDIIARGPFMGLEKMDGSGVGIIAVAPGLGLGCESGNRICKDMLEFYKHTHYVSWAGKMTGTVVDFTTTIILSKAQLKNDQINYCNSVYIYPDEYFDPMNYYTGEILITENTRSIHRYASSWLNNRSILKKICSRIHSIFVRLIVTFKSL